MTVKELKEALNSFPDNCIVMVPSAEGDYMTSLLNVSQGVNEFDGVVFLDDYREDD